MAQKSAESKKRKVKFPQVIRHRRIEATIYGRSPQYPRYRLAYYVAGKRRLRTFATYGEARAEAKRIVRELAGGSQATALTGTQARDAIAAFERLQSLHASTGRHVSLLAAVSEFSKAVSKLNGRPLCEAVEGFLSTVATVKRKDVGEAVEEFIASREPKTLAKNGRRAQLSARYAYDVGLWLRHFAKTFPGTAIADLTKEHLNLFMATYAKHSAKSRNHYRQTVKMFLRWAVKRDYLPLRTVCLKPTAWRRNSPTRPRPKSTAQPNCVRSLKQWIRSCDQ